MDNFSEGGAQGERWWVGVAGEGETQGEAWGWVADLPLPHILVARAVVRPLQPHAGLELLVVVHAAVGPRGERQRRRWRRRWRRGCGHVRGRGQGARRGRFPVKPAYFSAKHDEHLVVCGAGKQHQLSAGLCC